MMTNEANTRLAAEATGLMRGSEQSTTGDESAAPGVRHSEVETPREAFAMALYLCLVLGAEFVVVDDHVDLTRAALGVIWGTSIGLAFAHVFAFGLASRLFAGGEFHGEVRRSILWQLATAFGLAVILSVPFLVADVSRAFDIDSVLIVGFIAVTVYFVARSAGSSRGRAIVDGIIMLVLAAAVILGKAALVQ